MKQEVTKELQSLIIPGKKNKELYFHKSHETEYAIKKDGLYLSGEGELSFDTYFNSFSVGKWLKYTGIDNLTLELQLTGDWEVAVIHAQFLYGKVIRTPLIKTRFHSMERGELRIPIEKLSDSGILYPVFTSKKGQSCIHDFSYQTQIQPEKIQPVRLALDICTFRREEYVINNIRKVKENALTCESSPLYGNLTMYISDNGQTLELPEDIRHPSVKVYKNKNAGGVGGFTRGIMEVLRDQENESTHVLLMDDDVIIEPYVLEKTYIFLSLLKQKYRNCLLGGGLLRLDQPYCQYEAGGQWNEGNIKALNHNIDLRDLRMLLKNESEDYPVEYTGWWYTCLPLDSIDRNNLPLPLFIHRDDIEYGIRIGAGNFITLNGIGVWHEAFENKMPGLNEYYDVRNLAIVNAIHSPDFTKRTFKKFLFKWVSGNIARFRYQYVDLNLKAAVDFCRGFEWILNCDGQKLHGELGKLNYKAVPVEELAGYRGLTKEELIVDDAKASYKAAPHSFLSKLLKIISLNGYFFPAFRQKPLVVPPHSDIYQLYRRKEIVYSDTTGKCILAKRSFHQFFICYMKMFKTFRLIDRHYEKSRMQYRKNYRQLISYSFWSSYLELD